MHDFFFIRLDGKYVKVNFQDIRYLEARRNYIKIVTERKNYTVLITMKQLEKALPVQMFCRVHRSYIVSIQFITAFDHAQVYLNEKAIPVSEQYKKDLLEKVNVIVCEIRSGTKLSKVRINSWFN